MKGDELPYCSVHLPRGDTELVAAGVRFMLEMILQVENPWSIILVHTAAETQTRAFYTNCYFSFISKQIFSFKNPDY